MAADETILSVSTHNDAGFWPTASVSAWSKHAPHKRILVLQFVSAEAMPYVQFQRAAHSVLCA
eukprot:COSAG02_NODE_32485_length_515_cov_1.112981_1_plen_62_part_10